MTKKHDFTLPEYKIYNLQKHDFWPKNTILAKPWKRSKKPDFGVLKKTFEILQVL